MASGRTFQCWASTRIGLPSDGTNILPPVLLHPLPASYSSWIIRRYGQELPVAIFRPFLELTFPSACIRRQPIPPRKKRCIFPCTEIAVRRHIVCTKSRERRAIRH